METQNFFGNGAYNYRSGVTYNLTPNLQHRVIPRITRLRKLLRLLFISFRKYRIFFSIYEQFRSSFRIYLNWYDSTKWIQKDNTSVTINMGSETTRYLACWNNIGAMLF